MNESIFFLHLFCVLGFLYGALWLGPLALTALIAVAACLANLFILKQITLFGLSLTCTDVFMIASMVGLNLMQEYFGKKVAHRAAMVSFFTLLFFFAMSVIHLLYRPALSDE